MQTKYGVSINNKEVIANVNRLTNQLWKLIPMRENGEDWQKQLQFVIVEISGLSKIFDLDQEAIHLLSNLEGIKVVDLEFVEYRRMVFESITILRNMFKHGYQET